LQDLRKTGSDEALDARSARTRQGEKIMSRRGQNEGSVFFQCAACGRFYKREHRPTFGSNTYCPGCGRGKKAAWRAASQKSRDARKRAWELHANDKTPEQIAQELDRELSTVQRWLRLIPKGKRKR
jgi:hypothetical protein